LKLKEVQSKAALKETGEDLEVVLDRILIAHSQNEDRICRLVVKQDKSVQIYNLSEVFPLAPVSFKISQDRKGRMAILLSKNKFKLQCETVSLFFTVKDPQVIIGIIEATLHPEVKMG
jgi:hypothetical protein